MLPSRERERDYVWTWVRECIRGLLESQYHSLQPSNTIYLILYVVYATLALHLQQPCWSVTHIRVCIEANSFLLIPAWHRLMLHCNDITLVFPCINENDSTVQWNHERECAVNSWHFRILSEVSFRHTLCPPWVGWGFVLGRNLNESDERVLLISKTSFKQSRISPAFKWCATSSFPANTHSGIGNQLFNYNKIQWNVVKTYLKYATLMQIDYRVYGNCAFLSITKSKYFYFSLISH